MKQYPSIPRASSKESAALGDAFVFDRVNGSNLRLEWRRKQGKKSGGWSKFGTRTRLLDDTDPTFAPAVPLFMENLSDAIEEIAIGQRWDGVVAYAEWHGPKSFAGIHVPGDDMRLTLFDVDVYRHGLLGPARFLKLFGGMDIPAFLGRHAWTQEFIEEVFDGNPAWGLVRGRGGQGG